jgi:preprotein translocase subunit SecD
LHLEGNRFEKDRIQVISMLRDHPLEVTVLRESFLTEADVTEARVVEAEGGFALSVHFDHRGQWLLEQYSAGNKGRRFAIESEFGPGMTTKRWLAAPVISRRIGDGVLTFTPDTSREEADQIVLGLNNVAKKVQAKSTIW